MVRIVPKPQKINIESQETGYIVTYQSAITYEEQLPVDYLYLMQLLQNHIEECLGYCIPIRKGKQEQGQIYIKENSMLAREEYTLTICEGKLVMEAGAYGGVLYGIQTLRQILDSCGAVLPKMEIHDYPAKAIRGFYHDVTRGRIPTLVSLKALADKLAFYKINQLQLYIEHSFLFRDFSEVWRDDTPLTAEEIMELDAYCKKLHIDLVPSIATFGHLYKVLCTKTYSDLCELAKSDRMQFSFFDRQNHHTLDVSNPDSIKLVFHMIDEYMPLFSSKYFNLCGDETYDLGKGRSKALAEEKGVQRMYMDFVRTICEYLVEKGKVPMFWGDIISAFPEAVSELPEETICLNWGYEPTQDDTNAKNLKKAGAKQVLCPGVRGWNEWVNHYEDAYENIKRMCTYSFQYNALGVLNTDWGDFGHINHPEFATTGMIYGAAFSWNKDIPSFESINEDISEVEYRDSTGSFVSTIEQIPKQTSFGWYYAVGYKEYQQGRIDEKEAVNFIKGIQEQEVINANAKLTELIHQLYALLSGMDRTKRSLVKAYIIAAQGIKLWNETGLAIKEQRRDFDLAVRLEYWYHSYKELWRECSKESELYRIGEVVFWYADLLRG